MNRLQESEPISFIIRQTDTPEFLALTEEYYLDPEEEADELTQLLAQGAAAGKEAAQ